MSRKKLLLASLISASMIPAIAQADTKNFEGLSAGLNLNLISAGVKLSFEDTTFDGLGGKQTQTAGVDVGYGFGLGGNSVLTVGLDADLSAATIAELTDPVDGSFSVKQKNRFGIYVAPGVAITKDALIYGKLGYNQMKGELAGEGGGSKTFRGVSYGAGTKIMISGNTFLKLEVGRYTFGSEKVGDGDGADTRPSATVGTIGIGMRF